MVAESKQSPGLCLVRECTVILFYTFWSGVFKFVPFSSFQAEEARKLGNDAMKSGKHFEAMIHYTHAIKNDPRNHEYYSNRSLALLKVDQYYHARLDAIKAIELKPDWPKVSKKLGPETPRICFSFCICFG